MSEPQRVSKHTDKVPLDVFGDWCRCGAPAQRVSIRDGSVSLGLCEPCLLEAETREREAEERRWRRERWLSRLRHAGLKERHMNLPFELDERWCGFAKPGERTERQPWFGMLCGPTGTGKTTELVLAAVHYLRQGWKVRRVTEEKILDGFRKDTRDLEHWTGLDLLAIDDLGRNRLTSWGLGKMQEVIDGRYERGAATLISTNFSIGELAEGKPWCEGEPAPSCYGRRIADRIVEAAGGQFLLRDESRRLIVVRTWSHRAGREVAWRPKGEGRVG